MDQLIFILPICNFTLMIIKSLFIMIEIRERLSIIQNNALATVDLRRTVIANDIKNHLDPCGMAGIHQGPERWRFRNTRGFTHLHEAWIDAFEISCPITMHRRTTELKITHLFKQRR